MPAFICTREMSIKTISKDLIPCTDYKNVNFGIICA